MFLAAILTNFNLNQTQSQIFTSKTLLSQFYKSQFTKLEEVQSFLPLKESKVYPIHLKLLNINTTQNVTYIIWKERRKRHRISIKLDVFAMENMLTCLIFGSSRPTMQQIYNKEQPALRCLFSLNRKVTQAAFASIIMTTPNTGKDPI